MADTPSLPPPVADDWIPLLEVFWALTHFIGDPEEALHDIRRTLLRGEVRSLRRRTLNDTGVNDAELARTFWRGIKLLPVPARDDPGRDTIMLQLAEGVTPSVDAPDPRFGIFYLHRADCIKAWPELAPTSTVEPKVSKHADIAIREEIAQVYERTLAAREKPPNLNELPDLVQPRVRERGHEVSRAHIKRIAREEFKNQRLMSGKHWRKN
jgi:hypothetical protein